MRAWCNRAIHDLLLEVTTPGSREIWADVNRTDVYVPDGTEVKPYKTAEDAALAANFMATAASPVHVHLAPGTYNEDSFSLSSYVKMQGSGWGVTILKGNDPNNHFITLGAATVLRDVNIWGPTLATKACIYHAAADTRPAVVADVTISRGYYGFYSYPVASPGLALLENFTFAYVASNLQSLVRAEGQADVKVVGSLAFGPINSIAKTWVATGSGAILTLLESFHKIDNSVGVFCDDSAWMRVLASVFSHGLTALETGTNGSPNIRAEGVLIHRTLGGGYTNDIKLGTVNSSIHYTGRCSRDRIVNVVGGDLQTFGMNDFTGEEGGMVLGELSVGAHETAVLPMIGYGRDAYLSGLVTGGQVTRSAGRVLSVAGGYGYINDGTNPTKITWTGTNVTVASGATEYIYINSSGVVSHSAVRPPYATNIILAEAIANTTDIVALTRDEIAVGHSLSRIQEFFEDLIGPLSVSAGQVTASATPKKLVLASGEFAVGISARTIAGSSPVTFRHVWRDGFGGWTYGAPTDTIDVAHYDNNSGTPAVFPANKYAKNAVYVSVSDDGTEVFVVYSQTAFVDAAAAQVGAMPTAPEMLGHYAMRAAGVVYHEGAATLDLVIDMRPMIGQNVPITAAAAADHDLLLNLNHDTHLQYLTTGRALTWHGTLPGAHVTNGDAHDHVGGDGAQIDHTQAANIGTRTHLQLESDIAAKVASVSGTAPIVSSGGTAPAISITPATTVAPGSLSAADKTKLDSLTSGAAVASVSGTAPIVSSGGTTPAVSITPASTVAAGSMSASDKAKLDGIAAGATANTFGNGYQSAADVARVTYNANTSFQTRSTLTTPALPAGTYRVSWMAVIDGTQNNRDIEAQLYNATDAVIVGVVQIARPANSTVRQRVAGFAEVTFTGAAKTFQVQYRTTNVASTVGISDSRIEIWRV
jgi:hypothetical protein